MNPLAYTIACITCLPDPGTREANAQGFAILFMLGMLALVFSVLFYTIYSFARKQRRVSQAAQP